MAGKICERLESRRLLAAISWDAGGDGEHWNDPANWAGDQVPTAADDVTIATGGVVVSDSPALARTITASVPISIDHTTLTVDGDVTFGAESIIQAGNLIINGNFILSNDATFFLNIGYSNPGSTLQFKGDANRNITGNGTINSQSDDITSLIINDTHDAEDNGLQLAIGSDVVVTGRDVLIYSTHSTGSIVNNGNFESVAFWGFGNYYDDTFQNGAFINNGSISMGESGAINLQNNAGATLTVLNGNDALTGNWHNDGTIELVDAAFSLGGNFTMDDLGTMDRTGGAVYLTGTLDNTGETFSLDSNLGSWFLYGTLLGGTYACTGDNQLVILDGTFRGVTVATPISIPGGALHVLDGMTLNSSITLNYGITDHPTISFDGDADQTLGGNGSIISQSGDSISPIYNTAHVSDKQGMQLTIGSGITISGPNLTIYSTTPGGSIVNQGTLNAASWYLGSDNTTFVNDGTITGEIFLQITNLHNNPGHSISVNGCYFALYGLGWKNEGAMSIVDSDLYLAGDFFMSDLGSYSRSGGGATHLFGSLKNQSQVLTLNGLTSDFYVEDGGVIRGGTIDATGGHRLFIRYGRLDGVTLDAPTTVPDNFTAFIDGGLTLNSTITLGNDLDDSSGALYFDGDSAQTLGGSGSIITAGNGPNYILNNISPAAPLTLGSGLHISGKNVVLLGGTIVNLASLNINPGGAWSSDGQTILENHATISIAADGIFIFAGLQNQSLINVAAGAVLSTTAETFSNSGTINLNGAMIIDYTSTTPLPDVQSQIISGFAAGAWTGAGIRSSAAAAAPGTGVGYSESAGLVGSKGGTFAGQPVDDSAVLVRYTILGDANLDRAVDVSDLGILAGNWQQSGRIFSQGDFNYDGKVDISDLGILASHWQQSLPLGLASMGLKPKSSRVAVDVLGDA